MSREPADLYSFWPPTQECGCAFCLTPLPLVIPDTPENGAAKREAYVKSRGGKPAYGRGKHFNV